MIGGGGGGDGVIKFHHSPFLTDITFLNPLKTIRFSQAYRNITLGIFKSILN